MDDGIPIRVSIVAADPDGADKPEWSKLNYTIASSNDTAGLFTLDTQTGVLTAASMIFNATNLAANYFGFNITVTDAGGLKTTALVVRSALPSPGWSFLRVCHHLALLLPLLPLLLL